MGDGMRPLLIGEPGAEGVLGFDGKARQRGKPDSSEISTQKGMVTFVVVHVLMINQ